MNNFAINLLGANGQIHSFAVPATVLTQVYQTLMESDDCSIIEPLSIPKSHVQPIEPVTFIEADSIQRGTRQGYCELYFNSRPPSEQRTELRGAGFKPSKRGGQWHWYGLCQNMPNRYSVPEQVATPEPKQETKPEPESDNAAFAASLANLFANA